MWIYIPRSFLLITTFLLTFYIIPTDISLFLITQLQYRHKRLLRNFHASDLAHPLLALLLLLKELLLSRNISTVALCQYVLPKRLDGLPGNNLTAYRRLNRNLKQMSRDLVLQLLAHLPPSLISGIRVDDKGQGVYLLVIDKDIQLYKRRSLIALQIIIKGSVAS